MHGSMTVFQPLKLMVIGLGNHWYPQTRHSVGQLVLESLIDTFKSNPNTIPPPFILSSSSDTDVDPPPNTEAERKSTSTSTHHRRRATKAVNVEQSTTNAAWLTKVTIPSQELELVLVKSKTPMNLTGQGLSSLITETMDMKENNKKRTKIGETFHGSIEADGNGKAQIIALCDELDLAPGQVKVKLGGSAKGHNGVRSLEQVINKKRPFWRIRIGIGRPERDSGIAIDKWVMGSLGRSEVHSCQIGGSVLEEVMMHLGKIAEQEKGEFRKVNNSRL